MKTDTGITSVKRFIKPQAFNSKTVKQIFIVSFLIAIIYPLINIYFILPSFRQLLIENIEDEAVRTAKYLEAVLISEKALLGKTYLPVVFSNTVERLKKHFNIEKVKVFSNGGEVIYSTSHKDVGKINKKTYFHEIVKKGNKYTKVVQKDTKSLEDRVVTVDVVETYVPIMVRDTFNGAFEIYYDITERNQALESLIYRCTVIPLILMFAFLVSVGIIILTSEKDIIELPTGMPLKKYQSPFYSFIILIVSIFVAEGIVVFIISAFPSTSVLGTALFDSSLLVALVVPILYFFLARPLLLHIAERNRTAEHERKTKDYLDNIIESSLDSIIVSDATGHVESVNESYLKVSGYKETEVIGRHVSELSITEMGTYETLLGEPVQIGKKFIDDTTAMVSDLFDSGKIFNRQSYLKRKDNKLVPVEENIVLLHNDKGDTVGSVGIVRDITERQKAEKEQRETREFLQEIFNNSVDGILLTDKQGCVVRANKAIEKMTGYEEKELIGKYTSELGPSSEESSGTLSKIFEQLFEKGFTENWESGWYKKDGGICPIEINLTLLKDREGNFSGTLGSIRDITERRKAEEEKEKLEVQLKHGEKMEAIGTLAGGVAHDLNNVLGAIVGYPDLLLDDIPEGSPMRKSILSIKESGERAAAIVADLLTLARRGVNVTEVLNLNTIISKYFESREYKKLKEFYPEVCFEKEFDTALLNIKGSTVHLSKVVMNLVSNAAEAMPGGGKITISGKNRYLDTLIKGYDRIKEGDYVVLTVSDNGTGMSDEEMGKIFEPFYTKKVMGRSGTGLGMAVVWGTVKDHKGYIDVESKKGEGTTFKLYFPVTREKAQEVKASVSIEELAGREENILVVDDVAAQREIASSILKRLNYKVKVVASGEEAVEYVKTNSADLVILDMIMEPGIDGLETYKRIIQIQPNQKAVIASGFSETDRVKEVQKSGAGAYIKKPYTLEKIGMAVKNELEKRS